MKAWNEISFRSYNLLIVNLSLFFSFFFFFLVFCRVHLRRRIICFVIKTRDNLVIVIDSIYINVPLSGKRILLLILSAVNIISRIKYST